MKLIMTRESQTSISKLQAWWLAIRPRTLPASISGVITGSALAVHFQKSRLLPALASLFVALLLQIGSNLANDVFDFEKGADSGERLGPTRVTQAGLLSPQEVKTGMWVVFAIAGVFGLYLAFVSSMWVIPIGILAILSAIAYTAGPYPLGYHGLGELFVFFFFGLVSVVGTYFVQAKALHPLIWWMSIPVGLIIVGILVVNNLRDIASDRSSGKNTLAVRFGEKFAKIEYTCCLLLPFFLIVIYIVAGWIPWTSLLIFIALPLLLQTLHIFYTSNGKKLNIALGNTGLISFFFSVLIFVAFVIA